jgi:hypothetical protein
MAHNRKLVQPESFENDGVYFWLEGRENGKKKELVQVRFFSYDPCPAFVIVATEVGKKHRCPREAVFADAAQRKY